jgi:flagellar biosynthesis/type III secretory pathway protein FliH
MTLALLWQDGQRAVGLASRLIRREDWAELLSSHQALQRAKGHEAAAAQRAAAAEAAAQQRGFELGREQGREEGLREVLARLRDEDAFVGQLHEQMVQLLTRALADLLTTLPAQELLRAQVERSLAAARREQGSRLLVAAARVDDARRLVTELLGHEPDWLEVLPGPGLHGADVVLESHSAILDGRLAAQVQAWQSQVAALLLPAAKESPHAR